jgi:hypothetical protein
MLGTADELLVEPEKKTVFMEDLSEAELNTKVGNFSNWRGHDLNLDPMDIFSLICRRV